jgi:hypothetical protein
MLFLLLLPLSPAVPASLAGWPACLPTTAVVIPRSISSIGLWLAALIFFYLHY